MLVPLLLACALFFYIYGLRLPLRWRLRHIPGPPPTWLIGNMAEIVTLGYHEAYRRFASQHGAVFKVFQGGVPTVVVETPELGRWINARLTNRCPIPYMESGEEERFNNAGILFARDAYHRSVRAAWQPMFHSGSLQGYAGLMNAASERLVQLLGQAADAGQVVDLWRMCQNLTMHISGTTAFGVELQAQEGGDGGDAELVQAAKAFLDAAADMENIYMPLQLMFPPLAPLVRRIASYLPPASYAAGLQGRRTVRAVVEALLRQHRPAEAAGKRGAAAASDGAARPGVAPGSFLDLMSRALNKETGRPFSDFDVVVQAFSFVLASQTAAPAVVFAAYLLATHPDKQSRLLEEIDAFGRDRSVDRGDLAALPYAEAVFKEVLRLYPPVPLTIREADRDLRVGPYHVPRGTPLAVSLYGLHRNPKYWRDPDAFVPERFLPGTPEADGCNLDAYMPFGEGTRACVGQRYAWQMTLIALVRLYQSFTFELTPGQRPLAVRMSLSLAPRDGLRVTAHRRQA